ncbi:hypothetical protein FQA39_LY00769 [Lamprigera yunnana]|nr:hypothetical protein FQA39_LY00769 [Lamprigera yunnana]
MTRILKINRIANVMVTENRLPYKFYTTQKAVKVQEDLKESLPDEYQRMMNITIKKRTKLPQKPPFAKNLFLGKFDTDILTYPQLDNEELVELNQQIKPVEDYYSNIASNFLKRPFLPQDFIETFKYLRLFGLQCSQLLDGRELNILESCKFNEIISSATSIAPAYLSNEHLGIQILLKNGTDNQKKKYLPHLISGEMTTAFCLAENNFKDLSLLDTTAKLSEDEKSWILNGRKVTVINGSTANLFIVVGQTSITTTDGVKEPNLTVLLVEKDSGGITFESKNTLGIGASNVADVIFNNTIVPKENVIGCPKKGDSVVSSILADYRLSAGPACATLLRKLLDNVVSHFKDVNIGPASATEADYVQSVIAEMTISLYGIESATYLTAGLLDFYENQDCLLESTILKVFAAEEVTSSALKCMDLVGSSSYMKDHWSNVLFRDALSYRYISEPIANLKVGIALLGLQFAGQELQSEITKLRNPLFYVTHVFKKLWAYRKHQMDSPTLNLGLGDYVHPSAVMASQCIEYAVVRLHFATEALLTRYGPEVVNQHIDLKELAECVIEIYIMTASIARASRSYCIGLQNANFEMVLALTYCTLAQQRVRTKINKVCGDTNVSPNENLRNIAKTVFKNGKYCFQHPLSRNY